MEIERRDFAFEDDNELIVESRADGRAAIVGYAAVYNRLSLDLGGFREEILPGAFDKILSRSVVGRTWLPCLTTTATSFWAAPRAGRWNCRVTRRGCGTWSRHP